MAITRQAENCYDSYRWGVDIQVCEGRAPRYEWGEARLRAFEPAGGCRAILFLECVPLRCQPFRRTLLTVETT